MKFSDIKVQHCYNIIFDPVRECEFDGKHLGIVLKKNNDNKTVIVAPLTREENGNNYNKHKIGQITTLPTSLKGSDSFVVYNQIRTVNASRMIALKEGSVKIQSKVDNSIFREVLKLCSFELTKSLTDEEKEIFYTEMATESRIKRIIDLTYQYQSSRKELENELPEAEMNKINGNIQDLSKNIRELHKVDLPYSSVYSATDIQNNIPNTIQEILTLQEISK